MSLNTSSGQVLDEPLQPTSSDASNASSKRANELKKLVSALPQIYQPIFAHPEFSCDSLRNCEDRLQQIQAVHDALALQLQRPVRVLDIGCAQGWFGLNLAKRGAQVIGIDFQPENVRLCNHLISENPELKIRFSQMEIEQLPSQLKPNQFDLVLGLSVFHQLCYRNGKKWTRDLLGLIFEHIPVALIETALGTEPGGFGDSQPKNPDFFVDQMPFFRVLSKHARYFQHVRPLYYASSRFWYLGGKMNPFTSWRDNGHGKRLFISDHWLVKLYDTKDDRNWPDNRACFVRESQFLSQPPKDIKVPALLGHEESAECAWLGREMIPGTPLGELIQKQLPYNEHTILRDVLTQLCELEKAGLICEDLSIWNVLIGSDGHATLIGFNEISGLKRTGEATVAQFSAFLFFLRQIVRHQQFETSAVRSPVISPLNLSEPYRNYVQELLKKPVPSWKFQFLLEVFQACIAVTPT